jgi:hypothetical protein
MSQGIPDLSRPEFDHYSDIYNIQGGTNSNLLSFEEKQEDKESGKQANFYFRGLTPFPL